MNNTIFIDPSISNFGYCVSVDNEIVEYGHKRTYSKYELHERVRTIIDELKPLIDEYNVEDLVYEYPDKGKYHATGIQTFLKLGVAIGTVISLHDWDNVYQYKPSEWKGRKSKKETQMLVKSQGFNVDDDNTADAIGIYLYHNGNYQR